MISCKKATRLMSVREARSLSQTERFRLQLHLRVCSLCRNYLKQASMIVRSFKKLGAIETPSMSETRKEEIRKQLNNEL